MTRPKRVAIAPAAGPRGGGTVLVALAVTVVAAMPVFLTGALGVEMRRALDLSVAELGAGVSLFFAASAVFSAPLGRVGQRLGARAAVRISALVTAASMAAIALAVDSLAGLLACLLASGVGNALNAPAVNAFVAGGVARGRLGLALGTKQAAIPVAVLLSGLSVPALALTVGWRAVFAVAVLPALVVTVVGGRLTSDHVPPRARTGHLQTRSRLLVALSAAAALGSMGGNSTAAFLVSAAVAEGVEQGAAGLLLAAASLTSVLIRVTAGGLVDRRGSEGLRACALLLVAGSVGYLLLALSGHWLLVIGALVAMGCGWGWPGVFQFAVVSRNRGAPATATGITQTGVYVGAAAGPVIFGALAGVSYSLAWGLLAVLALAGAAVAAIARRAIDAAPAASGALGAATSARSAR